MNNGKVRIYDLSKELNLDNKELLAICDQLNISVKSHSSTISEGEAERIRTAAEKQAAMIAVSGKEANRPNPKPNSQVVTKARPKPGAPHKQQILEIRTPKTLDRANPNPPEPQVAIPPQSLEEAPASPRPYSPPASPVKPQAPARPIRTNSFETKVADDANAATTPRQNQSAERAPKQKEAPPPPRPQLAGPPLRPVSEEPDLNLVALNQAERPILKRDQPKPTRNKPVETTTETAAQKPARRAPGVSRVDQDGNKTPAGLDFQRPKVARLNAPGTPPLAIRPKPAGTPAEPNAAEEETDDVVLVDDESEKLLRRPTLPRPSKGGKKWQEEEVIDEGQDSGTKAGKAGTKVKRLKPLVDIDEEEDLDDSDLDLNAPIQVSLFRRASSKTKGSPNWALVTHYCRINCNCC
jgi:translation initiation factor IF-2